MNLTIKLDKENQRFYAKVENRMHEVRFRLLGPKIMEVLAVNSDASHGIVAEELLYTTFLFAQKEGIQIIPACDEVVNYLNKHKEFLCVTYPEIAA